MEDDKEGLERSDERRGGITDTYEPSVLVEKMFTAQVCGEECV